MEWIAIGIIVGASLLLVVRRARQAARRLLGKPTPAPPGCHGCDRGPCQDDPPHDCP